MADCFHSLSLGQGQAPRARKMIEEGVKEGHWVFLANCHLSLSWMPELDKLVEEELQIKEPHKSFRLWLSSSPHPDFPISILQSGIKMTTEPPKGLKANMKRLYQLVPEATFPRVEQPYAEDKYKKLLFALCFFHSLLIERRKFLQLGWNVVYGFNDSDFEVSEHLLSIYLDEYQETPWDALKYLVNMHVVNVVVVVVIATLHHCICVVCMCTCFVLYVYLCCYVLSYYVYTRCTSTVYTVRTIVPALSLVYRLLVSIMEVT